MPNPMTQVTCASIKYAQDGRKPFVFNGTDGKEYKGWAKPGEVAQPQPGQTYMVETYTNRSGEPVVGKMFAAGAAQPPQELAALNSPPYVPQAPQNAAGYPVHNTQPPAPQFTPGASGQAKDNIILAQVAVKAAVDIWISVDQPDPFNDLDSQLADLARQVVKAIYQIKGELDAAQ